MIASKTSPPKCKMAIDKGVLYGEWAKGEAARQRLHTRIIAKANDIAADDDVEIHNEYHGMTLKHLIGVAVIITAILAGFAAIAGALLYLGGKNDAGSQPNQNVTGQAEPLKFRVSWEWPEGGEGGSVERLDPDSQ